MDSGPHVVAICGSLREESYTRPALDHALETAEAGGASADLIDLRELELPIFDADERDASGAPELRKRVRAADSVLLGTPVYHGSYSSAMKNALDYCGFDEFENTTVGLLCVAGGGFPITSLDHLRAVCRALNAWVLPHQAAIPRARTVFEDGAITDDDVAGRVATLGRRAVEYSNIEPDPACLESIENVGADD